MPRTKAGGLRNAAGGERGWGRACLVVLAATVLVQGCVDSKCYRSDDCGPGKYCTATGICVPFCQADSDCGKDEKCVLGSGVCVVPECTSHPECGAGAVCEDYKCVSGCIEDDDCPGKRRCFSNRCVEFSEACNCPLVPSFCGVDRNPLSPSSGKDVCVPGAFKNGVGLFFGSVGCSHCKTLVGALQELKGKLPSKDLARLVFVQVPGSVFLPEQVEELFSGFTVPVVQDTPDLGIGTRYDADWYHFVVADSNGCNAGHWGPLHPEDLQGEIGAEILAKWEAAISAECVGGPGDVDRFQDMGEVLRPADGGAQDDVCLTSAADCPLQDGSAECGDGCQGGGEDVGGAECGDGCQGGGDDVGGAECPDWCQGGGDVCGGGGFVEPFELQDVCQVEAGPAPDVGGKVPHFLCRDLNEASVTFGKGVSEVTLKEMVWIAYFGSCT